MPVKYKGIKDNICIYYKLARSKKKKLCVNLILSETELLWIIVPHRQ